MPTGNQATRMFENRHAIRRDLASRINVVLSKFGLESSVSGGKFDQLRQTVSDTTGYWADTSSASKPSRLLIQLEVSSEGVTASMPIGNTSGSFAYANTAKRQVGAIVVRVLPMIREPRSLFKAHTDWEWLLWYCFWPKLEHGSSGQVFDGFNPTQGTFQYMDKTQEYVAAGLVTLNDPEEVFVIPPRGELSLTYQQATEAIRNLIQVNLPPLTDEDNQPASGEGGGS